MKNSLLLLMTPNMSLKKWDELGQLSRELNYYTQLCKTANTNLIIFSYGRNDTKYLLNYPHITVLEMPGWLPSNVPYKAQNFIYHLSAPIIFKSHFKKIILSKTNQFSASYFGLLLKLFFKIPLVIRMGYYHSHFKKIGLLNRFKEWFAFKNCNIILTTSNEAAIFIEKRYHLPAEKILSINNSIDLNVFKPNHEPKEFDIIYVGRLDAVKNIKWLLQVLEATNLKSILIGKGKLDVLVKEITNNNSNIFWQERVDNVELPKYYNKARCVILLSKYEGNPKSLLEAMACGLPCIGTDVPGIRECITPNLNGILIADKDVDVVKNQILDLLGDNEKLKEMSEEALLWANRNCNLKDNIENEVRFYNSFLNIQPLVFSNI
jgi:glycosyltransferase involved in cell wall biosynthesis